MSLFSSLKAKWGSAKRYAEETRHFPRGKPISPYGGYFGGLLYAANPVYIELSQGGQSPLRGMFAFGGLLISVVGTCGCVMVITGILRWELDWFLLLGICLLVLFSCFSLGGLGFAVLFLWGTTDEVVRFDRKRQVLYKRRTTAGGVIEIPWKRLTPELRSWAHSPYFPGRYHQGLFIEYDENGKPCETAGTQHAVAIGGIGGHESGSLMVMEAVRKFMEEGYNPAIRPSPENWMRHDDITWRVLFTLINDEKGIDKRIKENNEDALRRGGLTQKERKKIQKELWGGIWGMNWMEIVAYFMAGPLLYPMFVLNLLIALFASKPEWPPELLARHAADLAQLKVNAYGYPTGPVSGSGQGRCSKLERQKILERRERKEQERQQHVKDYYRYSRLNAWAGRVATPLALGSTVVLIFGVYHLFSVESPPEYFFWLFGLSWVMSSTAVTITLLTTSWAQKERETRVWVAEETVLAFDNHLCKTQD